jgi:hypothetical protein
LKPVATQKPIDELIAEIREARKRWDALPLEDSIALTSSVRVS